MTKRQRRMAAQRELNMPVSKFKNIDLSTAPSDIIPNGMTRAFRNTRYTVMVYDNKPTSLGSAICALIQRHNDMPITNHWREIQSIKNEIFGYETMAIEYYPAESQLIDRYNIYWIWIYPSGVLPIPIIKP